MHFIQLDIYADAEALQILMTKLMDFGITGFELHDTSDIADILADKAINWDYIDAHLLNEEPAYLTAYVADDAQGRETVNQIRRLTAEWAEHKELYGTVQLKLNQVNEEDWENNWKQYYRPFTIGERFLIKPTWEDVQAADNRLILEIDPASTFGTGQHATTKLCIEQLEQTVKQDCRVLDLGCGSGILSIAALLLGAKTVTMVDIFENAVHTASENVRQNGFSDEQFLSYCGNIVENPALRQQLGGRYSIVIANIVADVLIAMCPYFHDFLSADGALILSGIIADRLEEVLTELTRHGFSSCIVKEEEDWNMIFCSCIE